MTAITNANGLTADTAPTAAWRLTPELSAEDELAIRRARLEGLQRRADEQEGEVG